MFRTLLSAALCLSAAAAWAAPAAPHPPGYKDTPLLPGGKWHVHDYDRPQPPVVTPGTCSTQETPGRPPSDAIVLFDGKDLSKWRNAKGGPARWIVKDGYMQVPSRGQPGRGAIRTKAEFGDCQLHIEWAAPAPPRGRSQSRGNSGVFLMGRYEIQVLDSYHNVTYPDGQAAAVYGQYPPLVNACRKPGQWQTYDILFTAPRFQGKKLVRPAYVTVLHNGVLVQNHVKILGATVHKRLPRYRPHGPKGPLMLQDHHCPVRYRNIWIRELTPSSSP